MWRQEGDEGYSFMLEGYSFALDRNESVILVLLDLSAAFDTVDHTLLVTRLSTCFGFQGTVLKWLKSYLSSRKLFVKVGNSHSSQRTLKCGGISSGPFVVFDIRITYCGHNK